MVSPFLAESGEASVPCLSHFVEHIDKVERREYENAITHYSRVGLASTSFYL
jgi:hypothetical protein